MKTHTTYTEIRHIMRLHSDGVSIDDISKQIFVAPDEVKRVITAKFPKKRTRKPATKIPEAETT